MNTNEIEKILICSKFENGLKKYTWIQNHLHSCDVSKDIDFQRHYNGFYRLRQRSSVFYQTYYDFMEKQKGIAPSFEKTLHHLYKTLGRMEASFASKLVATLDTSKPVWDSVVLKNIGLRPPYSSCKNREERILKVYHDLESWYEKYITADDAKQIINCFNKRYPGSNISDIKKIDLFIWQQRDNQRLLE